MNTFLLAVVAMCSVGALAISFVRLYMDWKRSKSIAWETAVRLMASDPDFRCRSDDFAELYSALLYLEDHPDYSLGYDRLSQAIYADRLRNSR